MPPRRGRRRTAEQVSYDRQGTVSRVPAETERGGIPHLGALFDGGVWEIFPLEDLTPVTWSVADDDWVEIACTETDPLEGSEWNWVLRDVGYLEGLTYNVEHGWTVLATQFLAVCDLLGYKGKTIQRRRSADERGRPIVPATSQYLLQMVGGDSEL
jgi:hypothetical protein